MEKKRINNVKVKEFFKKNIYYFIIALCLAAVITMITLTCVNQQKLNNKVEPIEPVNNVGDVDGEDKNTDGTDSDVNKPDKPDNNENPADTGDEDKNPADTGDEDNKPTDPVDEDDNKPTDPVDENPVVVPFVFNSPVANPSIAKDCVLDTVVFNSTLKQYQWCPYMVFSGEEGTNVMAAADGEIVKIVSDNLKGYQVTIKHNDELTSMYSSLNKPTVAVGDMVKSGDVIGTMSNTAIDEYVLGSQLQFSAYENGEVIDPNIYLTMGDK